MKVEKYVDENGEVIDYGFESKKPLLAIFFVIGTIIPLILVGIIIYKVFNNNYCHDIYAIIEKSSYDYLKDNNKLPEFEGDFTSVKLDLLYDHSYLSKNNTANKQCTGKVKITKYKDDYIYTLDVNNCDKCSVNKRYKGWSLETPVYKKNQKIVDVVSYYNIYDRQVSVTEWSDVYDQEEISKKKSKYGVRLPIEKDKLPEVPEGSDIVNIEKEDITYYRYSDKRWKWYDIVGNYSGFFSEQPEGFAYKDDATKRNTEYTEYSLNYPEEYEYRTIRSARGYKFYYLDENGQKVYANSGKYAIEDDVDLDVYTEREEEYATMYSYSDEVWRWYNGPKRKYSSFKVTKPEGFNYKDEELFTLSSYSSWNTESKLTAENQTYRSEEKKVMTRYRYVYEFVSLKLLDENLKKSEFENQVNQTIEEVRKNDNYKLDVEYKFKYRKAK